MNLSDLLKHGFNFKEQFSKLQQDFHNKIFEGSSGGGLVIVKIKGNREVLSIEISDDLISKEEKIILIDLLTTATNNAFIKLNAEYQKHFGKILSSIPGLSNLPEMPI